MVFGQEGEKRASRAKRIRKRALAHVNALLEKVNHVVQQVRLPDYRARMGDEVAGEYVDMEMANQRTKWKRCVRPR